MSELKKCPACNSRGDYVYDGKYHEVRCSSCDFIGGIYISKQQAFKSWNTQPRIEELTELLRECLPYVNRIDIGENGYGDKIREKIRRAIDE